MIYGYARVSTRGQAREGNSLEEQKQRLREHGAERIYIDAFTGTKTDRPQFQELLRIVKSGDTIVATKLDRVSRSAAQGIDLVDGLLSRGVSLHILNMGLMNNSPTGKLIRNIMFSFAEFERDMIVQRTSEGKEIARAHGTLVEGRPKKETPDFQKYFQKQKDGEMTVGQCCSALNVSRATWYNRVKGVHEPILPVR